MIGLPRQHLRVVGSTNERARELALAGAPIAQDEEVPREQLPFEFMLNVLRLREGFELARFGERTGLPPTAIERGLQEAERRGLLERDWQWVRPTPRGFDFLSDLQARGGRDFDQAWLRAATVVVGQGREAADGVRSAPGASREAGSVAGNVLARLAALSNALRNATTRAGTPTR